MNPWDALRNEADELSRIASERGPGPFLAPVLLSAAVLGGLFVKVYLPSTVRMVQLRSKLAQEQQRYDRLHAFGALRLKVAKQYVKLPPPEAKDGWLFKKILESSRAHGVTLDTISPQVNGGNAEVWTVSIPVTARLDWAALGRWLESLDNERPLLYVTRLDVSRSRTDPSGPRQVDMEISSAVPKKVNKL